MINKEAREQNTFVIFAFVFWFFLNQCYTSSVNSTYCNPSLKMLIRATSGCSQHFKSQNEIETDMFSCFVFLPFSCLMCIKEWDWGIVVGKTYSVLVVKLNFFTALSEQRRNQESRNAEALQTLAIKKFLTPFWRVPTDFRFLKAVLSTNNFCLDHAASNLHMV